MKIIDHFPHEIEEIETVWIPLSDGCKLAARLWLPESAADNPVPALFEYIPYRRRDFTRWRDEPMHRYFAGNGYASLRIDIRGSGDSDGLQEDEFLEQEMEDACEVIDWLARQSWCSGSVGMFGKSWGGMNSLMVAARRPRALRAIIAVCATDNRYIDTDHYLGGCLTDIQTLWGSIFSMRQRLPPDPMIVGDRWRKMWQQRLENTVQPMEIWFQHQRYDDFWKRGSVCEDYVAIQTPTFLVGGWLDGFTNSLFRLLASLSCPKAALVGPWGHCYPHEGWPGPATGFLQEAIRWWDHWLKGIDTGVMSQPALRAWMPEHVAPDRRGPERPGRWVGEDIWPSPRIRTERYTLAPDGLIKNAISDTEVLTIQSPQTVGLATEIFEMIELQAGDQREDDAGSLCFDTTPLPERVEILGAPVINLEVASDRAVAMIAVRVNDVAPDGSSLFVSLGVLNLTRRNSHEKPARLEIDKRYSVRIQLDDTAHVFPAGHKIRLALSTSYWHRAWPSPEPVTLSVWTGKSQLELPIRPTQSEPNMNPLQEPESGRAMRKTVIRPANNERKVERDEASGKTIVTNIVDSGTYLIEDHGLQVEEVLIDRYSIADDDPLSAQSTAERNILFVRGDWQVRLEAITTLTSTLGDFKVQTTFRAFEGDDLIDEKNWDSNFARDLN